MTEPARFSDVADAVLSAVAHSTELVWRERTGGLTRFANNGVHQHGEVDQRECIVRVCKDRRFGVVTTGDCTEEGIRAAIHRAETAAPYGPAAPAGLPYPVNGYPTVQNRSDRTRSTTPAQRVDAVARFTAGAAERDMTAAGAYATEHAGVGVANSHGVRAWHEWTDAHFSATAMLSGGGSAWIERRDADVDALELDAAYEALFDKADRAREVERLDPGRYTVLLEPAAVAELVQFLAWLGFGARQYLDGTSFMAGKVGTAITGAAVTIVDDPLRPGAPGMPFDYEGTPHHPLPLIENGAARAVVYDVNTAAEGGTTTTGHALPQPNTHGPLPVNMVMQPGHTARDDLIRQVDDGILITRFWYNRVVDPARTLVTGLTRDGTFRIQRGKLGPRVHDFRFNESVLDAFTRIVALSDTAERFERLFVPAMVIDGFTFSSLSGDV